MDIRFCLSVIQLSRLGIILFCFLMEENKTKAKEWASQGVLEVKNLPANRDIGFDPWVGKISWSRKWQTFPVFLPGKFHG